MPPQKCVLKSCNFRCLPIWFSKNALFNLSYNFHRAVATERRRRTVCALAPSGPGARASLWRNVKHFQLSMCWRYCAWEMPQFTKLASFVWPHWPSPSKNLTVLGCDDTESCMSLFFWKHSLRCTEPLGGHIFTKIDQKKKSTFISTKASFAGCPLKSTKKWRNLLYIFSSERCEGVSIL